MSGTIRTGFSTGLYWGSSEFDDMTVRAQNFNDGSQLNGAKSLTMRVRPVRAG
jgi:hypothetical protein